MCAGRFTHKGRAETKKEGEIKMAGQIIKRGEKKWLVRVFLGRDATGHRRYQNQTIHGTRKDAQTWLTDALRKQDLGVPVVQSKVSLAEYLKTWLETTAKPRVSEQTFRGYEWQLNHLINGPLGKARLTQVRAEDIQALYSSLSPSTARHVHAPLRSALSQAVKWHLIHSNPCDAVDLPRHKAREIQALTREQAARLLAIDSKHRVVFAFLLSTGARPSEALALKWTDIDLEKGSATIQRTLQWHSKAQGGGWYFADTKTRGSRRSVPLPASLVKELREHRSKQAEVLLRLGIRTDLVFCTSEATPILRRNLVKRHFKPTLAKAELPANLSLYALRHTCASLLLQAGTHPKVVAERLGHSSTTLTMDVYSHVAPGMQSEATERLELMLYG
jgi:integrase